MFRTAARVIETYIPKHRIDKKVEAKVADFVVTCITSKPLPMWMRTLLDGNHLVVNQLNYVRSNIILISIETKSNRGDGSDAKYKLAMFMVAWRERISLLVPNTKFIPLPGIIVMGRNWQIYWAVCKDDGSVQMLKSWYLIGSASSLLECYKLIAAVRYLCEEWGEKVFLPWFRQLFQDRLAALDANFEEVSELNLMEEID